MTVVQIIDHLKGMAHTHADSRDIRWEKNASLACLGYHRYPPMVSNGAGAISPYDGMFKIEDTSDYEAGTIQIAIYDSAPPTAVNAGWAKINIANPFSVAYNLALAVPATFITEEGDPIVWGYVLANFENAEAPAFVNFTVSTEAVFETYTTDKCHHLLGRVYGTKVTDGSLTTYNRLVIQQDHMGWINDVIWKECP